MSDYWASFTSMLISCSLSVWACADTAAKDSMLPQGFPDLIQRLARYSTFRRPPTEVNAVLEKHCTITFTTSGDGDVVKHYSCSPASGIYSARLDARSSRICGEFVMGLAIEFDMKIFHAVEALALRNFGKGSSTKPTFREWRYTSDKQLLKCADPIIMLSVEDGKTGRLEFAFEFEP